MGAGVQGRHNLGTECVQFETLRVTAKQFCRSREAVLLK